MARKHKIEIYRERHGAVYGSRDWRWRLVAPNHRTIAEGGEGYRRIGDLKKSLDKILGLNSRTVDIVEVED